MNIDLAKYKTIIFDCDGVVLNSNKAKVQAYFDVAKRNGGSDEEARAFVHHHVTKGSFPRNGKIEYYLKEIVKQPITAETVQKYLEAFEDILDKSLMECEIAPALAVLKTATPQASWMLLSGGDQAELRRVFPRREIGGYNLAQMFEAGIFGGPDQKDDVLARELANGNLQLPALFLGDSKYDHQAATKAGLDFVFLSDWTEVSDWQKYCAEHHVVTRKNIGELLA
ncbi:MAG TPA: HAD hydrolase-like protein [Methylotenera sp.]|nr:HAD hydrolase-like protein [Methylotenera sp.]